MKYVDLKTILYPNGIVPIKEGGTGATTATGAWQALDKKPVLLWEGEWNRGAINVPGSDKYTIFIIQNKSYNYSILATKHRYKKTILGIGGLGGDPYASFFEASYATNGVSAETWEFKGHQNFQSVGIRTVEFYRNLIVTDIWGVI